LVSVFPSIADFNRARSPASLRFADAQWFHRLREPAGEVKYHLHIKPGPPAAETGKFPARTASNTRYSNSPSDSLLATISTY
jgi:hypothetical protein